MNNVSLTGRITADPELKQSQNGTYYCQFTLAVPRPKTQNNPNPGTDFIPVVVFNGQAQNLAKFVQKGRQLAVTGSLRFDQITLQDGTRRTSIRVFADRVEFLGSPTGQQQAVQQKVPQESTTTATATPVQEVPEIPAVEDFGVPVADDDIFDTMPF